MPRTPGTVLAADDDSDVRSLYRHFLAGADEVRTAADGVAALDRLDEQVDVVLLDREMPRKDGVAVARELARRDLDPAVVMISGVKPGVGLLEVPVDDYLRKPVARETLLDRVRRALAVAEQPRPRRRLLGLATRRRIVDETASTDTLRTDQRYQDVVATLDRHGETVRAARCAVAVDRGRDPADATADPSVRESP